MSIKKLKQQVAAALIVAMTATNVLSAFAADTGTPATKREVTVKFNSGAGYWETASPSSAATFSNARKTERTEDKNKIATYSSLERKFKMDGEGFDAFVASEQLFKNDDGCYYVNLESADHWFAELAVDTDLMPEILKVEEGLGLEFAGWYDNSQAMPKALEGTTEIYNGAVLDAGWKFPQRLPETVDKAFEELIVVGMPQDAKLVLNEVEEKDKKEPSALAEKLTQINASAKPGETVYELAENTPVVPIDIKIENFKSEGLTGDDRFVTVVLPVPDSLKDVDLEADEQIIALHYAQKDTYVIPVEMDAELKTMSFALDLTQGFSPFFFVKAKAVDKGQEGFVKVKVTGSDDGYIAAWTYDNDGWIYLPLNEEVSFAKGTELHFIAVPHDEEEKEIKSYTITNTVTNEKETLPLDYEYQYFDNGMPIENDCEISAEFAAWEYEGDGGAERRNIYRLSFDSLYLEKPGKYESKVNVKKWNASAKKYENFDGWSLEAFIMDDYFEKWEYFNFDEETNLLSSKDSLELGNYRLNFLLNVENEAGETQAEILSRSISVGGNMHFVHAYAVHPGNGKIDIENYYFTDAGHFYDLIFAYAEGADWSAIEKEFPLDYEPRMYNYAFDGWQTLEGVKYTSAARLVKQYGDTLDFYAVTRFKSKKDGKLYFGKEEGSNQGGSNNSSGSSSGGGSRKHVIGGSSTTITSMTGSWMMGANGWKFLKTNGEYAANTWGYINSQWYYFNEAGDMVTGWIFNNGRWYYLNPAEGDFQGIMLTGVIFDPFYNAYFYAETSGAMVTGWKQVADKWYYFNPVSDGRQGALLADTVIDGYYVGADGAWIPAN